jgi:hypothetical protein
MILWIFLGIILWERYDYRHRAYKEILTKPSEIADLMELILNRRSATFFKKVIFFPVCEADEW